LSTSRSVSGGIPTRACAWPAAAIVCACFNLRSGDELHGPGAAGAWFKNPETPTLIFLGISIPQLFLTGFSWPREAIPKSVQAVGYIFPSDFAIDGIVRINQLGASLWEVVRDWRGLWCLAVVYFALAVMSAFLAKLRQAHG
jgi:ABC-2 type transport system permease protein